MLRARPYTKLEMIDLGADGSLSRAYQRYIPIIKIDVSQDPEWEDPKKLEDYYRFSLRQFFVTNGIKGKMDSVHPQWCGRRVDLYITYNADLEKRPKILLDLIKRKPQPSGRKII